MTAAQVAAQMAVEAANNQKSRCELPVDSVGLCEHFMSAKLLAAVSLCLHTVCVTVSVHLTVKLILTLSRKKLYKDSSVVLVTFGICCL